jgi:hypothetical protein
MGKRHLIWPAFLIILISIPVNCYSQKIENVVFEVSESKINIYYDLLGIAADQAVIIRAFVSTDGGVSYGEPLKSVTGDVGIVLGPGERRRIIWDVFEEVDELVSESVKFKVKADLLLSDQERRLIDPVFFANINADIGSKVDLRSYGFNLKAGIYLKQLGIGVRGIYYKTAPFDGNDMSNSGYYTGFGGGAVIEYDLIKNPKYSLYPFFYLGQTKIEHRDESISGEHSGYSIFYSPGLGLDIKIAKFFYLGLELEYYLAPVIDINDQMGDSVVDRIILDGFNIGISLKFVRPSG